MAGTGTGFSSDSRIEEKEGRFPLSSQKLYRKKKITLQIRSRKKQDPFHNGLEKDAKKTISRSLN
jgi:hypothetical protein